MRTNLLVTALSMAACLAMACGPSSSIIPLVDSDNNVVDANPPSPSDDASPLSDDASDANSNPDCDTNDSGTTPDSGTVYDSGTDLDSGVPGRDGGFPRNLPDAGSDSGSEPDSSSVHDSGTPVVDSGTKPDSGTPVDAGKDSGTCETACGTTYTYCVRECYKLNTCQSSIVCCIDECNCAKTTCVNRCEPSGCGSY